MSVYNEIVEWANTKPKFVKDALRRLVQTPMLNENDINDLYNILKSEVGFTGIETGYNPITTSDIPNTSSTCDNVARLKAISNLKNICALHPDKAKLDFAENGLTLIYGKNGAGKSSYSRLLKKVCWSRDNQGIIKKNVYLNNNDHQSAKFTYNYNEVENNFDWTEGVETDEALKSVYVFDSNCASNYIDKENPAEYKPAGLSLLDSLIDVCGKIETRINSDTAANAKNKLVLNPKFANTEVFRWYSSIENKNDVEISEYIQILETNKTRISELESLLQSNNPSQTKVIMSQKLTRYTTFRDNLKNSVNMIDSDSVVKYTKLKEDLDVKKAAYIVAKNGFEGNSELNIGSDIWRNLWLAAKDYATKEIHPQSSIYPDYDNLDICVLCQQPLSSSAKERLLQFNKFIEDKTNQEYNDAKIIVDRLFTQITALDVPKTDTLTEIIQDHADFEAIYSKFCTQFSNRKIKIEKFIGDDQSISDLAMLTDIVSIINNYIDFINQQILNIEKLITDRITLQNEYNELCALDFLCANRNDIMNYISSNRVCELLMKCKAKIPKAAITRKIGEIQDTQSIAMLNTEFVNHLNSLSPEIAKKVTIRKSRSSQGVTYQKCAFMNVAENINDVLSEGEQKIVALASFLSECTIDGSLNTIIFDDPVNSLDLEYRESIARKIINLSNDRQIVVLTHDLYFVRLLSDIHKEIVGDECVINGMISSNNLSGIPSDEIPYLSKNCQQRIDNIRLDLDSMSELNETLKQHIISSISKKMRQLIERTVEEVIANRTIERFSKNLNVKVGNLSNIVVTEKSDVDFLLSLFSKYSISEHDGGVETIPLAPDEASIRRDILLYTKWKTTFLKKAKQYKIEYNIQR